MSKYCAVCGKKIRISSKAKILDGQICLDCLSLCVLHKTKTIKEVKEYLNINNERKKCFKTTQILASSNGCIISIDLNHEIFIFRDMLNSDEYPIYYHFNEVENYELQIVDKKMLRTDKKGMYFITKTRKNRSSKGLEVKRIAVLKVYLNTYYGKVERIMLPSQNFLEFFDECILNKDELIKKPDSKTIQETIKYKKIIERGQTYIVDK